MGPREPTSSSRAEVRLVAQPASVPAARRFVSDVLTDWGRDHVADDVELCVSELATNATLHSDSPYFQVELEERAGTVRLSVADAGMGSVDVLARQPELSDLFLEELTADNAPATGRGMLLVSALAVEWGIDELPVGKCVWGRFEADAASGAEDAEAGEDEDDQAEDGEDAEDGEGGESPTAARVTWSPERERPALDPEQWAVVRFRQAPAALLVEHDQNLDDYTRELRLIGDRLGEPSFGRLATVLGGYVADHAPNWDPARIIAREALRDGREYVDFDVLADRDIRDSLTFLRQLIWEAEALSGEGKLLTLPAPQPVQLLRDWMEAEFLAQIEQQADPLPYPDWLAGARQDVRGIDAPRA